MGGVNCAVPHAAAPACAPAERTLAAAGACVAGACVVLTFRISTQAAGRGLMQAAAPAAAPVRVPRRELRLHPAAVRRMPAAPRRCGEMELADAHAAATRHAAHAASRHL
jgi:hypothetical protein